ncbi:hypothetical protein [Stutzerimonas stutzeri]|uniref:hypothetical protein n=1 Tax=Stutzerimonas stutzeri TaxID=316 RepID=UPI00031D0A69|nr:hypothetical protein [Stutzerimonas stutzeri]
MAKANSNVKVHNVANKRRGQGLRKVVEARMQAKADSPVTKAGSNPATATGSGGSGKPPVTSKTSAPGASKSTLPARTGKPAGRVEKDMGKAERVPNKALSGPAQAAAKKPGLLSRVANGIRGAVNAGKGKAGPLGLFLTGAALSMEAGRAVDKAIAANRSEGKSEGPRGRGGRNGRNTPAAAPASKPASSQKTEAAKPKASGKTESAKPSASKGSNYPVYPKKSSQAASFRSAFASARKAGKKTFTWEGRLYNTKLKGE